MSGEPLPTSTGHMRAVFTALFDAADAAGPFDEGRWEQFMRAVDEIGRFMLGYPATWTSELAWFGLLDDMQSDMAHAQKGISDAATELRQSIAELRAEREPQAPTPEPPPPVAKTPEPVKHEQARGTELPTPESSVSTIEPQLPNDEDRSMFAEVRRLGPTGSYGDIARALGITNSSRVHQRFSLLAKYGTLPEDIDRWRTEHKAKTGPKAGQVRQIAPWTPPDAEPESFDERRARFAKEVTDKTWAERRGSVS